MNNNRKEEIKKEDKEAFKGFTMRMILSCILGALIGIAIIFFEEILYEVPDFFIDILLKITPFASIVFSIVLIIISFIIYTDSNKKIKLWNQSDEENEMMDKIENKLSYILFFWAINLIISFFFLGVGTIFLLEDTLDKFIFSIIGFLLCMISCFIVQNKIVNLEKEINPMLRGSVYDFKFTEKWMDSCDEAIKLIIYRSCFKSYKVVSNTCIILFVLCVIGNLIWDIGIMPILIVTIIWLAQTISYGIESIKCSKNKIN